MSRILPSLLREYRRSHPAVQLRLTAMETPRQLEALAEGRLDAALIRPLGPVTLQGWWPV